MKLSGKGKKKAAGEIDFSNLPRHIAIIMDGNGRWAKRRGLNRTVGHAAGAETFRTVATHCRDLGIKYLTVYAFSTENWKRPEGEVTAIMELLGKYLSEVISKMEKENIKMQIFGDTAALSPVLRGHIEKICEYSSSKEGFQVNICLNYGGRDEILRAVNEAVKAGVRKCSDSISEEMFSGMLYSAGVPDPDLIIRTGGEMRISNFLLWQAAYSELYFTDTLWPDFGKAQLREAILEYQSRHRRYGAI